MRSEISYTTAACFEEVERQFPKVKRIWTGTNNSQAYLVEKVQELMPYTKSFDRENTRMVTKNPEDINRLLKENGFEKQLDKIDTKGEDNDLYILSLLNIEQ